MPEERPGTPGSAPAPGAPADPSMEDILASIRRILSEDEAGAEPPAPASGSTAAQAAPAAAEEEPLELTEEMLVSAPAVAAAPPTPPVVALPVEEPAAPPSAEDDRALLGAAAAAAAAASVGTLLRAVTADRSSPVHRGGPSIEDVVREELRPLLKEWLDAHLPPLVERLVRAEIERVVGRGLS
jgi:cell pole-organizing protein PopZ